jgi:AbrB family looped-hinge helix DNA binding protein
MHGVTVHILLEWAAAGGVADCVPFDKWRKPFQNGFMYRSVTLDKAGRVVLPKSLREDLRLQPGDTLELDAAGDTISLRPVRSATPLRKERGVWVFRTGDKLSEPVAGKAIRQTREQRDRRNAG